MANPDIETRDGDNNNNNNNKHQCLCEMTAREFFAGLAMMGMLASHNNSFKCSKRVYHQIRQVALDMADVMVKNIETDVPPEANEAQWPAMADHQYSCLYKLGKVIVDNDLLMHLAIERAVKRTVMICDSVPWCKKGAKWLKVIYLQYNEEDEREKDCYLGCKFVPGVRWFERSGFVETKSYGEIDDWFRLCWEHAIGEKTRLVTCKDVGDATTMPKDRWLVEAAV